METILILAGVAVWLLLIFVFWCMFALSGHLSRAEDWEDAYRAWSERPKK